MLFCRGIAEKGLVPKEVVDDWLSGGTKKNKLLQTFVRKIYIEGGSQAENCLRLEAYIRIRQAAKDWSTTMVGFAWHTEEELGPDGLKWNPSLGWFWF